jgi:acetate---CoA ligase (ADP-forming)
LSPDILHKTDIGGVRLGCVNDAQARAAIAAVIAVARGHDPAAHVRGALLQRMETGLAEVIIGYRRDRQVGPTVMIGMGGIHAEIYRDVVMRPAPVSLAEAARMVDAVRGLVVLGGYRGRPAGDRAALVEALRRFSLLACVEAAGDAAIAEAEINPMLVRREGGGVVALDAVLVIDSKVAS